MLNEIAGNEESLTVLCLSMVGIVAILVFGFCGTLVSLAKLFTNSRLKRQMLERGMSAFEIEQVLKAGSDESKGKSEQPTKPPLRERHGSSLPPSKVHA